MTELIALSDVELLQLAAAFESGRLAAPLSSFAVGRALGRAANDALAVELETLCAAGSAAAALRFAVATRLAERAPRPELVWTGEDAAASFRDTAVVMTELFSRAQREVLLSGFVVRSGAAVFALLAEQMSRKPELEVQLYLNVPFEHGRGAGETISLFAQEFKARQWPGKRLPLAFYDPRSLEESSSDRAVLHAKCVVVDRRFSFITSANFTPHALRQNVELGVLLDDARFARQIIEQFAALRARQRLVRLPLG